MNVIIPAAGMGKRFAALGVTTPKELLPLGSKPLIAHALFEASRAGFDAAVVVVSPAKLALREYLVAQDHPIPVEIEIQPEPLGFGDAVLRGWRSEPAGVMTPDDVVLVRDHWIRLLALHEREGAATLCIREVPAETTSRFGIAECDQDRVVSLVEKPSPGSTKSNWAIFGRYVVTQDVIDGMRAMNGSGELELTHGFVAAINSRAGVRAVKFSDEFYDCGTPAEYASSMSRFQFNP